MFLSVGRKNLFFRLARKLFLRKIVYTVSRAIAYIVGEVVIYHSNVREGSLCKISTDRPANVSRRKSIRTKWTGAFIIVNLITHETPICAFIYHFHPAFLYRREREIADIKTVSFFLERIKSRFFARIILRVETRNNCVLTH